MDTWPYNKSGLLFPFYTHKGLDLSGALWSNLHEFIYFKDGLKKP